MKTIPETEFLRWASTKGLGLDPKYPESAVLDFVKGSDSRFWIVPPEPQRRPHFLATLIDLMGNWKTCYVWRHLGSWPEQRTIDSRRVNDMVEFLILRGLGLPMGTADVIEFESREREALITLLFSTTIFGWSASEDLYIVPAHARQIVQTDHHDVVHVFTPDSGDLDRWISTMSEKGFDLPDDPPDWTFIRPSWMGDETSDRT